MAKNKRRVPRLQLTNRDINFFHFLFKYKLAGIKEIKTFCYPTGHIVDVRKRIGRIEKYGFVKKDYMPINNRFHVIFNLTELGLQALKRTHALELNRKQLKSESKEHDLQLIYIGESLKRIPSVTQYITENELQCIENYSFSDYTSEMIGNRSDGYAQIKRNNQLFDCAIEYEHSQDTKSKYEHLVIDYYLSSKVDLVFFFTKHKWVKDCIFNFENKEYKNSIPKYYIHLIENDLSVISNLTFQNRKGQTLTI